MDDDNQPEEPEGDDLITESEFEDILMDHVEF